jgi:alpha-tubulin suppressor-like RCC1 family protein
VRALILALPLAAALFLAGCSEHPETTGPDTRPPAQPPALATSTTPLQFWQLSTGDLHSCAVTLNHRIYCWGWGPDGQLGTGKEDQTFAPTIPVVGGLSFSQVSASFEYTCAVTTDDRAYCWGFNYNAQLGDGTRSTRLSPVAVAGNHRFRQISTGDTHACATTTDNQVYCWGYLGTDVPVAIGDGTTVGSLVPVLVSGTRAFRHVSAGVGHSCGVTTSDEVFCWGSNRYGQIGDGDGATPDRLRPARVAGSRRFRQVEVGLWHSCAVTLAGRAFCWGRNDNAQLGDGSDTGRFSPRAVAGGLLFDRVTAGNTHTCGEGQDERTYCWGSAAFGQLGMGPSVSISRVPAPVRGGHTFAQVAAGSANTCARTAAGVGFCWGNNGNGAVGTGSETTTTYFVPARVAAPM